MPHDTASRTPTVSPAAPSGPIRRQNKTPRNLRTAHLPTIQIPGRAKASILPKTESTKAALAIHRPIPSIPIPRQSSTSSSSFHDPIPFFSGPPSTSNDAAWTSTWWWCQSPQTWRFWHCFTLPVVARKMGKCLRDGTTTTYWRYETLENYVACVHRSGMICVCMSVFQSHCP